jgi:ADP-heptose:LPS heptosyltransferase
MLDKRKIKRIGVFRALQLGDLICAIPAIRALKSHLPDAEIHLIGLPGYETFVKRFNFYFAGFIPFPGYPGLPEQPFDTRRIAEFITYMQDQNFDLLLQMQGNGTKVNQLIEILGAKYCAGFFTPGDHKPDGNLFMPYPDYGHEIERHLNLMIHLGITGGTVDLEFPVTDEDIADFKSLDFDLKKHEYVCIHPGSRGTWRQWPPEYFAEMAEICCRHNLKVVLTGTKDEIELVNFVSGLMKHQPLIAAGRTHLGSMAVLLKNALALISNCTGVSHMASALKVPGIIISMDGEPHRWGPLNSEILHTVDWIHEPQFIKVKDLLRQILQQGKVKSDELQAA